MQEFLKSKGETIYPEGLVSGNYLSLTVLAVKRYQASKSISQTGYFGPLTRAAANSEYDILSILLTIKSFSPRVDKIE